MLYIETSSPKISGNEYPRVALPELAHNSIPLLLVHISVHAGDSEVVLNHLLGKPLDLCLRIAEDDCLGYCQTVIEVTKGIEFPLLLVNRNEELLYPLQRQLVTLYQDLYRIVHELTTHLQDLLRQSRAYDYSLSLEGQKSKNLMYLVSKSFLSLRALLEHLICLVENEHFDLS